VSADAIVTQSLQTNSGTRPVYESSTLTNWSHSTIGRGAHPGTVYRLVSDLYPRVLRVVADPATHTAPGWPKSDRPIRTPLSVEAIPSRTAAVSSNPAVASPTIEPAAAVAAMVQTAKQYLSLNITEIAKLVGVERSTIYGWLRTPDAMPRMHYKMDRLAIVYAMAQAWKTRAGRPLGAWRQVPLGDGRSLLDALPTLGPTPEEATAEIDALVERLVDAQGNARAVQARAAAARLERGRSRLGSSAGAQNQDGDTSSAEDTEFEETLNHLDWFRPGE
jgi:hypothetical protein